jgi:hypothetical protein
LGIGRTGRRCGGRSGVSGCRRRRRCGGAARHLRAEGLLDVLTEAVADEWWRETTLLYAATADADPIVQACLDDGTAAALALAFDCSTDQHTLAPQLRDRLDEILQAAFEDGADPAHRRRVAAVLAARLAQQTVTTTRGTRILARPVPTGLYWLFLRDTHARVPDGACPPGAESTVPVTGVWGPQALAFVSWLNGITTDALGQARYRLPTEPELTDQAVRDTLAAHFTAPHPLTCLWTRTADADDSADSAVPQAWRPPGHPDPHQITGTALRQAVTTDTATTPLLLQLLLTTVRVRVRARVRALDRDLARPRGALNRNLHFARTLARALARDLQLARTLALDLDLDLYFARILDHARHLDDDLDYDRELDRDWADSVYRDFDRDLARILDFARDLDDALDFDRGWARDLDRALALGRDLVRDIDLARVRVLFRDCGVRAVLEVTASWSTGQRLGTAFGQAFLAEGSSDIAEVRARFAAALTAGAGVQDGTEIIVPLDGSLSDRVREACTARGRGWDQRSLGWNAALVGERLADLAAQLLDQDHLVCEGSFAARVRIAALALTDDDDQASQTFRELAATVTLLEQRAKGQAPTGESIVLALL